MADETLDLIDTFYDKDEPSKNEPVSRQILRKSPKAKYQIFDESEFTRGGRYWEI